MAAPTKAWLQTVASDRCFDADHIAAELRRAGLDVILSASGSPPAPGIVFFDRLSDPLYRCIRSASAGGRHRVLAVASAFSRLNNGEHWRLLDLGASDVVSWDTERAPEQVAARLARWAAVDDLVDSELVRKQLVGHSPAWRSVLRQVVEVARFTDSPLLITGESGTGKELVARLIHQVDARPNKPDMVVVDCTTVVPSLSGSEFFGHERGSFTGAVSSRDGAFAAADGGTLFLDEVGELSVPLQAELLRVVQEGMYQRVGSLVWQHTNFRLICATNRDLHDEEAQGRFRRDFYYRIAAVTVRLPALRDRPEDIVPLFEHFLGALRGGEPPPLDPVVSELLLQRSYPGNVRDLRQLAVRVNSRHVGPGPITAGDIPEEERPTGEEVGGAPPPADFDIAVRQALAQGLTLKAVREAAADAAIRIAIDEASGSLRQAAARLGITDRALQLRRAASREMSSAVFGDLSVNGDQALAAGR